MRDRVIEIILSAMLVLFFLIPYSVLLAISIVSLTGALQIVCLTFLSIGLSFGIIFTPFIFKGENKDKENE